YREQDSSCQHRGIAGGNTQAHILQHQLKSGPKRDHVTVGGKRDGHNQFPDDALYVNENAAVDCSPVTVAGVYLFHRSLYLKVEVRKARSEKHIVRKYDWC